jgi:hypothetical protein
MGFSCLLCDIPQDCPPGESWPDHQWCIGWVMGRNRITPKLCARHQEMLDAHLSSHAHVSVKRACEKHGLDLDSVRDRMFRVLEQATGKPRAELERLMDEWKAQGLTMLQAVGRLQGLAKGRGVDLQLDDTLLHDTGLSGVSTGEGPSS